MKQGKDWVVVTQDSMDLKRAIVKQVEWYFSDTNLLKDYFLLQHMDPFGAVPLSIIASFPKMQQLTQDMDLVQQSIVEYATKIQLNEQQMTIRRVDSNNYTSCNQCVKLRVMDSHIWESIESSWMYCGLWNCLLFGCFDIEGYWNWIFPSQWHAKAAQHRILQICPFITKQWISLCSFTNDGMFSWHPNKEEEKRLEEYYSLGPSFPFSYSIGSDIITVPVETQISYSSYDHTLQEPDNLEKQQASLPISTCLNRNRQSSRNKQAQSSSIQSNSNLEQPDKKPRKILKNMGESRQRQTTRKKGKNSQQQNGKQRITSSFQIQAEDFPPLPGEKQTIKVEQSSPERFTKEQENIEEAILAFGELCVSNSESNRDRERSHESMERLKSYAHVAASFLPSIEQNKNCDVCCNSKNGKHHSLNIPKRRQRRREGKYMKTLRNFSSVTSSNGAHRDDNKGTSKHRTRNKNRKLEDKEWLESPVLSNEEESLVNKENYKEAEYLVDCDIKMKNEIETIAKQEETLEEKTENEESENCVCALKVAKHSSSVLEETPLAMLEQTILSGRLSPTAVDSTCCGNWQLASSQVSEPISVVENVICDDEAKSILQVLEQLHTSMDSRELDSSSDQSFSKQLERVSEVETEDLDDFPSASVVLRSPSSSYMSSVDGNNSSGFTNIKAPMFFYQKTVSSSSIEEGLKFFAKGIFS
ncbi:hypothetical protein GpartN1_g6988.t1 [Galdieria partita]|uniref:HTH La-type RNA-binding domain-containing protein n=1 Tax=Galdieria partita TaxID=83374 RepID=A0A9C7Q409_9RHOD|nr:hypothetical protein GpartN1_g6988.t1 [Galdieria partita]